MPLQRLLPLAIALPNPAHLLWAEVQPRGVCRELLQECLSRRGLFQLDDGLAEDGLRDDGDDLGGRVLLDTPVDNPGHWVRVHRVVAIDASAALEQALEAIDLYNEMVHARYNYPVLVMKLM